VPTAATPAVVVAMVTFITPVIVNIGNPALAVNVVTLLELVGVI